MSFDWSFALDILPEMLYAFLRFSLVATVLGILVAAVLGLAFAIVRRARVPVLAPLTTAFIDFVRSTPLLVQLFFLFFVLPEAGISDVPAIKERMYEPVLATLRDSEANRLFPA